LWNAGFDRRARTSFGQFVFGFFDSIDPKATFQIRPLSVMAERQCCYSAATSTDEGQPENLKFLSSVWSGSASEARHKDDRGQIPVDMIGLCWPRESDSSSNPGWGWHPGKSQISPMGHSTIAALDRQQGTLGGRYR
jgi:hypothetical protein